MVTIASNNWFFSAIVQANAALIAIVSAFVINKALNEFENIHTLDSEFNDLFYEVRCLINGLPKTQIAHTVKPIHLEQAIQIGSSRSDLTNWQEKSVYNYNALVRLYLKEINKKERLSIICKWMYYVRYLILVLVIMPACFIFPEGVQGMQLILKPAIIINTIFSLKSFVLLVTYFMVLFGLGFILGALKKVIVANTVRIKSIKTVFNGLCNEPKVNSVLINIIEEK